MEIMLKDVRIAFPAIAEKQAIGDGEPAYGAKFIIVPGSPIVKVLDDGMLAVAKAMDKWKPNNEAIFKKLKEDKKVSFIHAPYCNKNGVPYLGFEDMFSLGSRNASTQPTVFDKYGKQIPGDNKEAIKSLIYSGCYVNAKIQLWAQDNQYGRRINASLLGVMFSKDGEAFGGAAPAKASDFAELAADPAEAMDTVHGGDDDLVG